MSPLHVASQLTVGREPSRTRLQVIPSEECYRNEVEVRAFGSENQIDGRYVVQLLAAVEHSPDSVLKWTMERGIIKLKDWCPCVPNYEAEVARFGTCPP